jgi:hypothetical protein
MVMNRPPARPLVPEDTFRRVNPSIYLSRAGAAHLRSFITGQTPLNVARSMFGEADLVTAEIIKAATTPATTTTGGWAREFARTAVLSLIQDAASLSAAASIIARGLSLDLGHLAQLTVPSRPLTPNDAAKFVQEGVPITVRAFNFAAGTLRPYALKTITTYSRELSESSSIDAAVRQTLAESFGLGLDAVMLSASAGSASQPAGLFQSAAITAATGGGATAMFADIKALMAALAQNGAGANVVFVAPLPQVATLKAQLGPKWDFPIFPSSAMAAASIGAVDATSLVSGFGSEIEFEVSKSAALHMDTTPSDIGSGGTLATPIKSTYQLDLLALKATMKISWTMRVSGHAQLITACTW